MKGSDGDEHDGDAHNLRAGYISRIEEGMNIFIHILDDYGDAALLVRCWCFGGDDDDDGSQGDDYHNVTTGLVEEVCGQHIC